MCRCRYDLHPTLPQFTFLGADAKPYICPVLRAEENLTPKAPARLASYLDMYILVVKCLIKKADTTYYPTYMYPERTLDLVE